MSTDVKKEKLLSYLGQIEKLPTLPVVATQILVKTSDPDFSIDSIVDLVMTDQVLTAKMIRLVNSAYWGLGLQIQSLRQAIIYLGTRNVRNVVLTTSLMQIIPGSEKSTWLKSFWSHSFGCALISRLLAQSIGYRDLERAYLAGLLHDIGEIILMQNFPEDFKKVIENAEGNGWDFYQAEKSVLGISHVDFGPWLLEQWKICGEIAHVVSRHHNPENAVVEPILVALVRIADMYAKSKGLSLGFKKPGNQDLLNDAPWNVIERESLGSNHTNNEAHLAYLEDNIEAVQQFINMIYD